MIYYVHVQGLEEDAEERVLKTAIDLINSPDEQLREHGFDVLNPPIFLLCC